jgi:hypothetical protein
MKIINLTFALAVLAISTINHQLSMARAQGTAFTYQGQLNSGGNPANGSFDLTFTLFNTNATGVAIAGPVTNSNLFRPRRLSAPRQILEVVMRE